MKPYSSARDEYSGVEGVFLDANENPLGSVITKKHYNRYPDPFQTDVNTKIIWVCSPNNPTGNVIERNSIKQLLNDFTHEASYLSELDTL